MIAKPTDMAKLLEFIQVLVGLRQIAQAIMKASEPEKIAEFLVTRKDEFNFTAEDLRTLSGVLVSLADSIEKKEEVKTNGS